MIVAARAVEIDEERVRELVRFTRDWLDRLGSDATQCTVIRVRGDLMEPRLPNGCTILFDRNGRFTWCGRTAG